MDTNQKKTIQWEEQHNVELSQKNAEEQQEVVLVMEEEMVKPQLEEQSNCHAKISLIFTLDTNNNKKHTGGRAAY